MQHGSGRNPAAPPHSQPPPAASPSSSSSPAASMPSHLGLEAIQQQHQQQQQQLMAYRQALQQQEHQLQVQQSQKADREHTMLTHQSVSTHGGMLGGSSFPPMQGAINISQLPRKFGDLPHQPGAPQLCEQNPNKGQHIEQHLQNPIHPAYLQYAFSASQHKPQGSLLMNQQGKMNIPGSSGSQGMHLNNFKVQELMSLRAANHSQASMLNRTGEHFAHSEKQLEQGLIGSDQRNDPKPSSVAAGHVVSTNMQHQLRHAQANTQNIANNQLTMAQMQAMQVWAKEHNIDLTVPANLNLLAQFLPHLQSNRLNSIQKQSEASTSMQQSCLPSSKQSTISLPVDNENSAYANCVSDFSSQVEPAYCQSPLPSDMISSGGDSTAMNPKDIQMQQQGPSHNRECENDRAVKSPSAATNGGQIMHLQNSTGSMAQTSYVKNDLSGNNMQQVLQCGPLQQQNRHTSQPENSHNDAVGTQISSQSGSSQVPNQQFGFTKQQLYVLKAQILAFRRLKRGERNLPPEVLQAIAGMQVDSQAQLSFAKSEAVVHDKTTVSSTMEHTRAKTDDHALQPDSSSKGHIPPKEEPNAREEKSAMVCKTQGIGVAVKESLQIGSVAKLEENRSIVIPEQETGKGIDNIHKDGNSVDKGKALPVEGATVNAGQVKKPTSNTTPSTKGGITRNYHGPIFDFPSFTRKNDFLSSTTASYPNNMALAYDVKDLLLEEGKVVFSKKKTENLRKINGLLAVNLERKRIQPDLVMRLQIEERKLRLLDRQARLRDEVDQQQQEIMSMSDRPYRKFVKQCERQRIELLRQVQQMQKASRDKQLKSIFQWRKKLLETHWAIRDARTTRNRGVAKYHEKMLREFSKRKDDDRNKRMEALKNNDVDRYREMLLEQQSNVPGDAAQRYVVLSSFLSQTEEYLHKLGGKISAAKSYQEVQEVANAAAAAARAQGLSEEEVKAAAACAGEEVMIRLRFSEMNAPKDSSSVNKYYNLAHAVTEKVVRQPSMLRFGTLRDYQLVGLQWMLSLYNNKLNGILADEMGLGKTVQVMSLIAYLMEFKGNYGPHLIIVPNAVLVNWKSELLNWLPSISCIFYVGGKDARARLFSQEVRAVKFNVLVTTYEFVMYDRSKLSKIDWKYIIIDEAQRMKDRESVLARDLDRYRCQRRLLLTGTPLQNDLKELWSLLNVLLPEIFDNRKAFHDWFSKPFQKDLPSHNPEEDDWLETEKKVIIIHRLHQILEPFMLRRRVEDVEGSLPPKVPIVLRCRMSAFQGAIYDWIRSTGTLRVDPEDEMRKVQKNPMYQVKMYRNLNNRCMELRKVCNHPLLNYPYFSSYSNEFIVRSCGKLWILDRILIKLQKTGHRVLLFSTMTKLLDILEEYLQWRQLVYRRIDGTTTLEDRESAIVDFNSPNSDCFIFLLSIRAAGRGLNLQTADTVVIYDPDPNPQNEEQAVARAHRIGQTREVKVIYLEAVVDKVSSYQKEDEMRHEGAEDSEDDLAGKDRYMGSIESLIRNNIQQYKIDMADEVINAGRFDQRTTHEERRLTLETLLHDEERFQETVHDVPSLHEVNCMIARSEEEVELFDQMDEELDWSGDMVKYNEVPKWLRASSRELDSVVASMSKKSSKNILSSTIEIEQNGVHSGSSPCKTEKRRGRPKGSSTAKKFPIYKESDDEENNNDDVDSDERNPYEEEGDMLEFEDEEFYDAGDVLPSSKDQAEEGLVCDSGGEDFSHAMEGSRNVDAFDEAGSTGSSGSRRLLQPATPCTPSQKFGSISALDARPGSSSKKMLDELEEGEIAVSGDSLMDVHQSDSFIHDNDDVEDEQVVQPKIRRKRSIRLRPRYCVEKTEDKSSSHKTPFQHGSWQLLQVNHTKLTQSLAEESNPFVEAGSGGPKRNNPSLKKKRNSSSRVCSPPVVQKSGRLSTSAEDGYEHSMESWSSKAISSSVPRYAGSKMSDSTQRKCKNVISKLQRRIQKDGNQLLPLLSDWWRGHANSTSIRGASSSNVLDLQTIEQRVDSSGYNGVMDFIADLQLMLKNIVRNYNYSYEVKSEAVKLQELFFDIMKIAFPDADFHEAKNAVTFPSPGGAVTPSPRQIPVSETKRHPAANKTETSSGLNKASAGGLTPVLDEGKSRSHTLKPQKESRSTAGGARQQAPDCSQLLAHPGDLVICKKRRKDRDKSAVKQISSPTSPSNPGRATSLVATSQGLLGHAPSPSMTRNTKVQSDSHPAQQAISALGPTYHDKQQFDGGFHSINDVQWAKPVKRTRTDTGKRRPSHM
ncbi:ATP-dependent helicase BRM-like isoform X1 [Canna indica]|uniref:ATP-dependent helicase BRM-like isoform X1 n=1 Tax=Canna indica TaxID=4628 RepID=A0AAQ3QLB1_9LILI|nr:ATP-dependent helicase BRM-like isoform X1 [Canna indica]